MSTFEAVLQWASANTMLLVVTAAVSVLTFVGSLVIVPIVLARMPADYFVGEAVSPLSARHRHPVLRLGLRLAKNLLGCFLLCMGFVMLFLPGQGILTLLLGLALVDFPGKRRLEKRMAHRPHVRRAIDWIRHRAGRPPLRFEEEAWAAPPDEPGSPGARPR